MYLWQVFKLCNSESCICFNCCELCP